MTLVYLDSSAITKLAIQELGSADLRAEIDGGRWVTSRIAVVEVSKAVGRVAPALDLTPIFDRLAFVEIDEGLAGRAARTGGASLRALDAIHVASAELFAGELDAFVTYDARQASAARAAGLTVRSPGVEPG